MVKKTLKKKAQAKPAAKHFAVPVVESAREIWLAGLGAFTVAQQESGRILEHGSKLFEKLVAEGGKVEQKTRKDMEDAFGDLRGEVESRVEVMKTQAGAVQKQATENWDKLEKIFEDRVARSLARLGMPGKEDVTRLAEKVQKLTKQVEDLDAKAVGSRPAAQTAVKKAVAKKAPVKKAAPKKAAPKKAAPKKAAPKKAAPKKAAPKKAAPKKAAPKKAAPKKVAVKKAAPKKAVTSKPVLPKGNKIPLERKPVEAPVATAAETVPAPEAS